MMTSKERFEKSLLLQEVDKLPHGEQMIHDELVAQMLHEPFEDDHENALYKWMKIPLTDGNFNRHVRARRLLAFDWVHLFPIEPMVELEEREGKRVGSDIWGQEIHISSESFEIRKCAIRNETDLRRYRFPDTGSFIYSDIGKWARESDFWITVQIDTGFFKASQLIGFEQYMYFLVENPELLLAFMERFTEFQKELIERIIAAGADSIWFSNDHAFNNGPFISPDQLWEFDFRFMKELVDFVHSKGVPANFHSCGNLEKSLPLILRTGVNSIHAIQPSAGNDIGAYKERYGKDICFIGNLDMDRLMPKGSPEEIDDVVGELIRRMWERDRSGYILSTCNMLNNDQPVENAIMLHFAAEKYGH